jgi:hypothetical protein
VSRIDSVRRVEQAPNGGLLDEVVKDIVNDVFEVGEEAIDRVSRRRSIEATAQPDQRLLKLSCYRAGAVDVFVVAVEKASEELWWLMNSCSPPLAGANTSYSSRNPKERYSNSGTVSVAATFKKSSTEVTFCRVWALLDTVPMPCNLVRDAFYDTLHL